MALTPQEASEDGSTSESQPPSAQGVGGLEGGGQDKGDFISGAQQQQRRLLAVEVYNGHALELEKLGGAKMVVDGFSYTLREIITHTPRSLLPPY